MLACLGDKIGEVALFTEGDGTAVSATKFAKMSYDKIATPAALLNAGVDDKLTPGAYFAISRRLFSDTSCFGDGLRVRMISCAIGFATTPWKTQPAD